MTKSKNNLRDYTKGGQSTTQQVAGGVCASAAALAPERGHGQQVFIVPGDCGGMRFDQVLAKLLPEYSRSRLQEWIAAGQASLDGAAATAKQKVWGGETIAVLPQAHPSEQPHQAEDIALDIVYEDGVLLAINKPAGLVVHPGSGNREGTLLNALLHHSPQLEGVPRAGIVHRLDKDTSGLLVVAKTLTAQTALVRQLQRGAENIRRLQEQLPGRSSRASGLRPTVSERQLQARSVKREYLALVWGQLRHGGKVDAPIARHPTQRVKMAVVEDGKPAVTHYEVEEKFPSCTLLRCRLETGRTHQIRVHLSHIGHPLVGDSVYLKGVQKCVPQLRDLLHRFPRQALHATCLALEHPVNGEAMEWHAPLPLDMQLLLQQIREIISPHQTTPPGLPLPVEEVVSPPDGTTSHSTNLTVSQSDQGMQCKAKSGEKAEFTCSK